MTRDKWNDYQKAYHKDHYTQLSIHIDKELATRFKEKLKKDGISTADFTRKVINEYLEEKKLDK